MVDGGWTSLKNLLPHLLSIDPDLSLCSLEEREKQYYIFISKQ